MSASSLLTGLRLFVALAVMMAVVPFASHGPLLPEPAGHHPGLESHHVLPAADQTRTLPGHDHAHDDACDADHADTGQPSGGHVHSQHLVDHSHVTMGPVIVMAMPHGLEPDTWEAAPLRHGRSAPSFPFDRPPRRA